MGFTHFYVFQARDWSHAAGVRWSASRPDMQYFAAAFCITRATIACIFIAICSRPATRNAVATV